MNRVATVLLGLAATMAWAAPPRHELPPEIVEADCVVFSPSSKSAKVFLPDGMAEGDLAVVIADGKVAAVGVSTGAVKRAVGATWNGRQCAHVDTSNKTLTPGLIDVSTQLGLVEVSAESSTRNTNGAGDTYGAALRVADGYDPSSTLIPVARVEGITSAVVNPGGGRIAGWSAFVDLAGASQADAIIDETVAVVASLEGPSRAAAVGQLRAVLEDARLYARNRAAFERRATRDFVANHRDLDALQPVVRGEVPLVIGADRAADIEALLRLAREQRIRLVIRGGAEAHVHAAALAAANIAVIVDPLVYGPGGFDQRFARADNAAVLDAAGVPIMLSTFSSHNARLLRHQGGNAVRGGLSHDAALKAITATPARVFGQNDRGSLAPGQVANVVVWTGDPLELRTSVAAVWIGGRPVPLDSRQWRLFMAYEKLPGTPVPALSLPSE